VSYNASVATIYNATSSKTRFKLKKIFFHCFPNAQAYYSAGVVFEHLKAVGLDPE
jgi:hypothetical protein